MRLEAVCGKCHETFIPHSMAPAELIHGVTEDGDECGGKGKITREYHTTPEALEVALQYRAAWPKRQWPTLAYLGDQGRIGALLAEFSDYAVKPN